MIVCIVFNSKYILSPKPAFSQTVGRDTQQAAKHLRIQWRNYEGKGALAPLAKSHLKAVNHPANSGGLQ